MRYLCLGYHNEQTWAAMSDADRRALLADNGAYDQRLRQGGHVVDARALQSANTAATLRFDRGGAVSVTDGPFTETKEQLGGVMVLEAADLNEAIRLMSQLPCMRVGGCLEIRPINENL
jgi:hypothetical protein